MSVGEVQSRSNSCIYDHKINQNFILTTKLCSDWLSYVTVTYKNSVTATSQKPALYDFPRDVYIFHGKTKTLETFSLQYSEKVIDYFEVSYPFGMKMVATYNLPKCDFGWYYEIHFSQGNETTDVNLKMY